MTRHISRRFAGAGALLVTGALTLTACGGSGFEEPADDAGTGATTELTSSDDALSVLIASSGDAETDAVTEADVAPEPSSPIQVPDAFLRAFDE